MRRERCSMTSKQIEAVCKANEALCRASGCFQAMKDIEHMKACDEATKLLTEAIKAEGRPR